MRLEHAIKRIKYFDSLPHPIESKWYGLDSHLLDWLGLPRSVQIVVQMYHGPDSYSDTLPVYLARQAPVLVGRDETKENYEKQGKVAFVTGSVHAHYRHMQGIQKSPDARGTIAFPSHSTHHNHAQFDVASYAEKLLALPERFQPVAVCAYWKDILNGNTQAFLDRGIPVFTAGHIFDPNFCVEFYDILKNFAYATSNVALGTASFLSIEMGLPFFVMGAEAHYFLDGQDPNINEDWSTETRFIERACQDPLAKEFYRILPRWEDMAPDADVTLSKTLADLTFHMMGGNAKIDKHQLRKLIFLSHIQTNPSVMHKVKWLIYNQDILPKDVCSSIFHDNPEMRDLCHVLREYPEIFR
ncbi:hypothetical protein M2352_005206 [Azospirillum fermentarium]|uniref:hypothetical protein n=1 Tax=Azospirillum fermentarium TaxID=1233114 RepID=UPI0022260B18|nr:hypothetical protein [Azospirillum fermentarium]MCW2249523.1 hypothetical protein [Azospirillum fermentarium]